MKSPQKSDISQCDHRTVRRYPKASQGSPRHECLSVIAIMARAREWGAGRDYYRRVGLGAPGDLGNLGRLAPMKSPRKSDIPRCDHRTGRQYPKASQGSPRQDGNGAPSCSAGGFTFLIRPYQPINQINQSGRMTWERHHRTSTLEFLIEFRGQLNQINFPTETDCTASSVPR
jgi:hypothetical protein